MSGVVYYIIFMIVLAVIAICFRNNRRNQWVGRINNTLNGELGQKLKQYVYPKSAIYEVYGHAIVFCDGEGNERVFAFSQFGYEDIPVVFTDIVCEWIAQNIVSDKNNYITEKMEHTYETLEGQTSDRIEIRRSISGYTVDTVPGNSGHYVDKKSLLGYKLYHKSYENRYANNPKLKTW